MPTRRALLLAPALPAAARAAAAQGPSPASAPADSPAASPGWAPSRPVRMVVPFAPGGQSDTVARLIQPGMSARLGVPVVVENRTGAGGSIGAGLVAQAAADGHTVLFDAASFLIVPFAVRALPFSYERDFEPVGQVAAQPYVLAVSAGFAPRDLDAFLAAGRAGEISYGSPGVGSVGHLAGALLASRAGLRMEHVSYRGGAEAARDLAAGTLQAAIISNNSLDPLLQAGRAFALALTGAERRGGPPGVPTIAESGFPGFDMASWNALFVRAGTPRPAVDALAAAINHAIEAAGTRDALRRIGSEPVRADPDAFDAQLGRERAVVGRVVAETGISFG